MPVETLPFSVHPEIFAILGEELVSDPVMALSELVKNAYDADAENVEIEFTTEPKQSITITDDGHGMTHEDVSKGWLVVGTPLKRKTRKARSRMKGRVFSGSMGIGRLAAFSIADEVDVTTVADDGCTRHFTIKLKEITDLDSLAGLCVGVSVEKTPGAPSGTVIRLTGIKQWLDPDEMLILERRLGVLCGPEESKDFRIDLTIDGETKPLLPEEALPEAPISVEAEVLSNGKAVIVVNAAEELYLGDSVIPETGWEFISDRKYNELHDVILRAFWYPLGIPPRRQYWKLVGQEEIQAAAGTRVYRDNVRVLPYGEPGDDWLGLEHTYVSAGPMRRNPRPLQVVGWIFTMREKNPELKDTANREGLRDTSAFGELRDFGKEVYRCVAEVRQILEPVIPRDKRPSVEDVSAVVKSLRAIKEVLPDEEDVLTHFQFLERVTEAFRSQSELTSLYRDRLTAGNLVGVVMHDVGVALKPAERLLAAASEVECDIDSHSLILDAMSDLVPRIIGAYDLLKGAGRAGAYRVSNVKVQEVVSSLIERINLVEASRETAVRCACDDVTARLREADLWSIVINLVLNAVTSSDFAHARNRIFPSKREVRLSVTSVNSDLIIECEDNGPGLPDKPEGWIWAPFNSTKEKGGSGLGLYIVSDAATWYRGRFSAGPSDIFDSGAKFRIILPGVVTNV